MASVFRQFVHTPAALAGAVMVAVGGLGISSVAAQVSLSLTAAPLTATSQAAATHDVRFDLLALNEAEEPTNFTWPSTLPCRLTTPDGAVNAIATRLGGGGDSTTTLQAHGFARQAYAVHLVTVGRVMIDVIDGSASGTIVDVAPPGAAVVQKPEKPTPQPRNPLEAVVQRDPNYRSEMGLVESLAYRFKPHEPVYILGGWDDPELKYQVSFKYQIFDPNGSIAQRVPALGGLYFGYSQTSLWDLDGVSNPFFDTSYRPEALVSYDNLDNYLTHNDGDRLLPDWLRLGFQAGVRHESNGRDGDQSRSLNYVYARPIVTFAGDNGWFASVAPTVFTYIGDLSDNPDIESYRGHGELRVVVGQGGGVQLATTARIGDGLDHGSLQFDLSMPIRQLSFGNFDVYFDTQYFTGYGESLLRYDERVNELRFGISLVR